MATTTRLEDTGPSGRELSEGATCSSHSRNAMAWCAIRHSSKMSGRSGGAPLSGAGRVDAPILRPQPPQRSGRLRSMPTYSDRTGQAAQTKPKSRSPVGAEDSGLHCRWLRAGASRLPLVGGSTLVPNRSGIRGSSRQCVAGAPQHQPSLSLQWCHRTTNLTGGAICCWRQRPGGSSLGCTTCFRKHTTSV